MKSKESASTCRWRTVAVEESTRSAAACRPGTRARHHAPPRTPPPPRHHAGATTNGPDTTTPRADTHCTLLA